MLPSQLVGGKERNRWLDSVDSDAKTAGRKSAESTSSTTFSSGRLDACRWATKEEEGGKKKGKKDFFSTLAPLTDGDGCDPIPDPASGRKEKRQEERKKEKRGKIRRVVYFSSGSCARSYLDAVGCLAPAGRVTIASERDESRSLRCFQVGPF